MIDYSFYTDIYLGNKITDAHTFARMIIRAESRLSRLEDVFVVKYRTPPRAETETPDFMRNMALCAIAEELITTESSAQPPSVGSDGNIIGTVKSVSIGSVSASFDSRSVENVVSTEKTRLYEALRLYADVYRGVR